MSAAPLSARGPAAAVPAWEFAATGTRWRLYHSGTAAPEVAAAVAQAVELDEARWSRFRPDSELSALNHAAGSWLACSAETLELLDACGNWTRRTDGVFQPLIGGALSAWCYRVSVGVCAPFAHTSPASRPVSGCVAIDRTARRARVPAGCTLDLAGIAKAWIARRAAAIAAGLSDDPALLLDAGGDLVAITGEHLIALEHGAEPDPSCPAPPIRLPPGRAVATSGHGRRSWVNGDGRQSHHLIDPGTGAPGPLVHATVVADDLVTADVTAKVLALRPERISSTPHAPTPDPGRGRADRPRYVPGVSERNVLGGPLEACGTDPLTGFYRDGCCHTGDEDRGSHTICAVVTEEFLEHQQSIGNDLITAIPLYGFPGLVPGDRWCVTAANWLRAHLDGAAALVVLASTHERALDIVPLDALEEHAVDIPDYPGALDQH